MKTNPFQQGSGVLGVVGGDEKFPEDGRGMFSIQIPFMVGYVSALDGDKVDEVARSVFGFPLMEEGQRRDRFRADRAQAKLLTRTSRDTRRDFVDKLHASRNQSGDLATARVKIEELRRFSPQGESPSDKEVAEMIYKFVDRVREWAQVARVVKGLVMHDLVSGLESIKDKHMTTYFSRKGCLVESILRCHRRLVDEMFLLRYAY